MSAKFDIYDVYDLMKIKPTKAVFDRFVNHIENFSKPNDCWNWDCNVSNIRPRFYFNRENTSPYRSLSEWLYGKLSKKLIVDHLCNNRRCVNPLHLIPTTYKINLLRIGSKALARANSLKESCPVGHPLEGDNLLPSALKNGRRACRTCINHRKRTKRAELRGISI